MRTTIALDDELVAEAQDLTGLEEKSSLIHVALKALIERKSARRLALLGGADPDLKALHDDASRQRCDAIPPLAEQSMSDCASLKL